MWDPSQYGGFLVCLQVHMAPLTPSDADLDLLLDYQDHADPAMDEDEYDPFGLGGNMDGEDQTVHAELIDPEGLDQTTGEHLVERSASAGRMSGV